MVSWVSCFFLLFFGLQSTSSFHIFPFTTSLEKPLPHSHDETWIGLKKTSETLYSQRREAKSMTSSSSITTSRLPILMAIKEINDDDTSPSNKEHSLFEKLKVYGLAGFLGYGVLNTVYYSATLTLAYIATNGGRRGSASTEGVLASPLSRFAKVFGIVWAGSQVTKAFRAWAAVAFAPIMDQALTFVEKRLQLRSKLQAFIISCSLTLIFFFSVVGCLVLFTL
mmetsp:Transcript_41347/g.54356  ORF Transcript_41347/g.54356 Transcript_41347/m.54356 type:complete len:224 (-) Transcript_41347:147-818(-)